MGKVVAHYVDEEGNVLLTDEETSGQINVDSYATSKKEIANWTFKEIKTGSAAETGTYTDGTLEVTYVYTKTIGKVIANYVDENGKPLMDAIITTEQTGSDYETKAKEFKDYKLIKVDGQETGKYVNEDTVVTYVYQYVNVVDDKVINTGITDSFGAEIFFIIMTGLLTGAILIKKRYN